MNHPNLTLGRPLNPSGWSNTGEYLICRHALSEPLLLHSILLTDWIANAKQGKDWAMTPWIAEVVFEEIRNSEFPSHVNRLTCWYAWESEAEARAYAAKYRARENVAVYRCDIASDARTARVDLTVYDQMTNYNLALPIEPQIDAKRQLARTYYSGNASSAPMWELLVDKPLIPRQILP